MKTKQTVRTAAKKALLFCLCLLTILSCAVTAAAVSTDASTQTVWVEFKCSSIPEGFNADVFVDLIHEETGEEYILSAIHFNDYVGRVELPVGKYQISDAYTYDSQLYNVAIATNWFTLTEDMHTAFLLEAQVNMDQYVLQMREEAEAAKQQEQQQEEEPAQEQEETPEEGIVPPVEEVTLDDPAESETPESSGSTEETPEEEPQAEPTPEPTHKNKILDFIITLAAVAIFVCVVVVAVFVIRRRMDGED